MASSRTPFDRSPVGSVIALLVAVLVIYVLFSIVGWIIALLYRVAPLLFIASLIIDHRVFLGYVQTIRGLFNRNWVYGLLAVVFSVALYPFLFLYFLGMALFKRKVSKAREEADIRRNGRWTDYEELPDETLDLDTDYEELPPPPPPRSERREEGDYDQYFK